MHALRAYAKDDPSRLVYEQAPRPFPQDGEVVVRVHASGVTPSELSWPTSWVNPDGTPRPLPVVPGHEVAGEVDEVSLDADGLNVGQPVFGLIDFQRDGADAEYVVARATELAPMPPGLSYTEAAAVPLSALTAWQALFEYGALAAPKPPDEDMPDGARSVWFSVTPRRDQLTEIADLIVTGHVRPIVSHVRPLAAGRNAYDTRDHAPGKIVLRVSGERR